MMIKMKYRDTLLKNNFFKKNIKSLKACTSNHESLPEKISEKISVLSTSCLTLRYENILLHSSYDPEKEALRFADKVNPGARVCLYGIGLGYHLNTILKKIGPDGCLLAIELNLEILAAALQLRDLTEILEDQRFRLIYGTDEIKVSHEINSEMGLISKGQSDSLEVLFHAPSFKCIPSNFPSLTNALEVLLLDRRFPSIFRNLEEENYSLNKKVVIDSPGINTLKDSYQGKPGILVSAGPSLDLILPHLHRIQKEFLIVCVDTAFPILINNNIPPDYVISLDPQLDSTEHFIGYKSGKTKLVFMPTSNHNVMKIFNGERYVVFKENHNVQSSITRMTPLENLQREKSRKKKQLLVKCVQGNFLITNQVMYSYLRTLEHIIKANPKTRFFNLLSHGAEIEKAKVLGSANELKFFASTT